MVRRALHAVGVHRPRQRRSADEAQAQKEALAHEEALAQEEARLRRGWSLHSSENLDSYLVRGYQDPRINAQSILVRHHLTRRLFGAEFEPLMRQELEFSVEANEAIRVRAQQLGVDMRVGMDPGRRDAIASVCESIADGVDTFERRWSTALAGRTARPLRVLELACGSANDYRFFASYGLAPFLDYTGIDLNPKNVANALRRFPDIRFQEASVLDLPYEARRFDYVLAFDIFEHLSLAAMNRALAEATRVTRGGLLVAFFIMTDRAQHREQPLERYHWNVLSADQIQARTDKDFAIVDLVHIKAYLSAQLGYDHYYNPNAWSLFADRRR